MARDEAALPIPGDRAGGVMLERVAFVCVAAAAFVAAGIPWYTLRLFPVVSVAGAKVNLLDVLVGLAAISGLGAVLRQGRRFDPLALVGFLLTAYMLVPLTMGMMDPDGAFFAVREMRALAYYVLAGVLVLLRLGVDRYRAIFAAWVAGGVIGAALALLHVLVGLPLAGYDVAPPAPAEFATIRSISWNEYIPLAPTVPVVGAGFRVQYLEWSAVVVAVLIAAAGVFAGRRPATRLASALALIVLVWYAFASGSRGVQAVSLLEIAILAIVLVPRGRWVLPVVVGAAALLVLTVLGARAADPRIPSWVRVPLQTTVSRWMEVADDRSFAVRVEEMRMSLKAAGHSPIIGLGLGSATPVPEDADPSGMARNVASGYAFLLVKTGIMGLGLYLLLMAMTLARLWSTARRSLPLGEATLLRHTAAVGVIGMLVLNLVHKVADIPEGVVATALFAGVAACSTGEEDR